MKFKFNSTIILALILFVLAGGYGLWQYLAKINLNKAEPLLFGSIDTSQITKIEIIPAPAGGQPPAVLEADNGKWAVASANFLPAASQAIGNLLGTLPQIKIKELVSTSAAKQTEYLVSSNDLRIKIYQGERVWFDFYAGKNGPVPASGYYRQEGNDNVYLVSANLQPLFDLADGWVDHKIIEVDQNSITKATWQYPQTSFSLELKDGSWQINSQTANQEKVKSLLAELNTMTAQSVDWAATAPAKAKALIIMAEGAKPFKLSFVKNGDNYAVRKDGDAREFIIDSYAYGQIAKKAAELK